MKSVKVKISGRKSKTTNSLRPHYIKGQYELVFNSTRGHIRAN